MGWMSELRTRPAVRKGLIAGLSAVVIYTLFGFLAVPAILKYFLPKTLSEALHRKVSVKEIRFNPFVLSVTVRGLEISERGARPVWVSAEEIYANVQLASVVRGGPVLSEMRLARPYLNIVRRADGSYNFSDLLEENIKKQESRQKPIKYSLNNIQVTGGSVDFYDGPKETRHEIRDIQIGIPFVSNLKYYVNRYVQPSFAAVVNGDNVSLHGRAKPFKESLETAFDIDVRDLDIPHYLAYLPVRREYEVPSALLDVKVVLTFSQHPEGPPTVRVEGNAALREVRITGADGSAMIYLPLVQASISPANMGEREFRLAYLAIRDPEIDVAIDRNKKLNLSSLIPEMKRDNTLEGSDTKAGVSETAEKRPVFSVETFRLDGGKVRFSDDSLPKPFRTALVDIRIAADRLSTEEGKTADVSLSLRTEARESVSLKGTLGLSPLASEGSVALGKVALGKYAPYYMDAVRFDVEGGTVDVRAGYRFAQVPDGQEFRLSEMEAGLAGLRLRQREEKEDFLEIPELSVKEVEIDLGNKTAVVGDFATGKGVLHVRRGPDREANVLRLFPGKDAAPASMNAPKGADAAEGAARKPWVFTLKKGSIDRYSVRYDDRSTDPPVMVSLDRLRLRSQNVSTLKNRKGTFSFSTVYNRTGDISLAGDVTVDPPSMKARIRANALPIGVTQPYYTSRVKIVLTGGDTSLDGTVALVARQGGPLHAEYRGEIFLRDFSSVDKERSEDFLKFATLHFAGVRAGYNPSGVAISEIALSDFYSRIIVNPDGTLNVQGIVGKAQDNDAAASAPAGAQADNAAKAPAVPVRIDALTLQGGTVNFSDQYIRPNYSANLVNIGGRVTGLSSDQGILADVDLEGSLGKTAPIGIMGKINPLAENLFLDLQASVKDIDLSPLTPYSARYAGYAIEKGKLALTLKYHIEKEKLHADNKVFIDQFSFGEAVDSPEATKLPVRLAVALLKDRKGEIHLDIPVSGELDDPQFSVLGVVWRIIKNLLVKAATSPFALLGAIFGDGGEQLSYLEFGPGQATVPEAGAGKISNLAKILNERPGLDLDIVGHVDVERDREALRRLAFRRKLAALKAEDLANAGQAAPALDNVRIEPGEYGKYLTRAYRKEKFPKPRTFLGTLKTLPVPEMEKLMMTNIRVTDDDLRRLAEERAASVRDRLAATGSVDPGRIFIVEPKSLSPERKENLKDSRVDFRIK
jgi:uncharacterized protein involved in outer membrane biogenesis